MISNHYDHIGKAQTVVPVGDLAVEFPLKRVLFQLDLFVIYYKWEIFFNHLIDFVAIWFLMGYRIA